MQPGTTLHLNPHRNRKRASLLAKERNVRLPAMLELAASCVTCPALGGVLTRCLPATAASCGHSEQLAVAT